MLSHPPIELQSQSLCSGLKMDETYQEVVGIRPEVQGARPGVLDIRKEVLYIRSQAFRMLFLW